MDHGHDPFIQSEMQDVFLQVELSYLFLTLKVQHSKLQYNEWHQS